VTDKATLDAAAPAISNRLDEAVHAAIAALMRDRNDNNDA
jgi:hypothetical protein